jgi:mRNA interferase HigB
MQIIALRTLRLFWDRYPQAEALLRVWYSRVKAAEWKGPDDVKAEFGATVDFVADNRIIFDIGGNKYRLIVHVSYRFQRVLVKFVGTHKGYDAIDAEKVK